MLKYLDKILYQLYLRLHRKYQQDKQPQLVEQSSFYTKDYTEAMKYHKDNIKGIPQEILVQMIEMVELNKYNTYISNAQNLNAKNRLMKMCKDYELKGVLNTMERFKQMFAQGLPKEVNNIDPLTGKEVDKLLKDMNSDFEHRREYIMELMRKAGSGQKQENTENNSQNQ